MTYPIFVFKKSTFYVLLNPISICFKNELNNNLNGFSFGYTEDGQPGFREDGADAVTPFSKREVYKFCYYLTNNKSQLASANASFTVSENRKYKALIIAAPNGYDINTVTIFKNGSQIYTRSSGTYERNFFEAREFDLKKGDVISMSTSASASNAIMFAGVVWL